MGHFHTRTLIRISLASLLERNPEACVFLTPNFSANAFVCALSGDTCCLCQAPLLRIRSVYLFSQQAAARLAAEALRDFDQWLLTMFSGDKNTLQLSNFQTNMLSREQCSTGCGDQTGTGGLADLQRAIDRLSVIPRLGRTGTL